MGIEFFSSCKKNRRGESIALPSLGVQFWHTFGDSNAHYFSTCRICCACETRQVFHFKTLSKTFVCRRLTPDFKLRVEVTYRGRVCFPLTIRAHMLSQQEKDNLPEWRPEGMPDFEAQGIRNNGLVHLTANHTNLSTVERKVPTELKGTTYITHHFESNRAHSFAKSDQMSPYPVPLHLSSPSKACFRRVYL